MKKNILLIGLFLFIANSHIICMPGFCAENGLNEDETLNENYLLNKEYDFRNNVIARVKEFFDYMCSNSMDAALDFVSPDNVQLKNEIREEFEKRDKLNDFSCGEPKIIEYHNSNYKSIRVIFRMECGGFDPDKFQDVKLVYAKQIIIQPQEENTDSWKIVSLQDIASGPNRERTKGNTEE